MYAQPRNWDVGEINIDLEMIEHEDRTEILKTIEFSGDLTMEQRERLLEISDRCPVAKLLKKTIDIKLS
jgi:putative redox protein